MPHPNVSRRINTLVDNQVMYRDMTLGSIIHITALDARDLTEATFRVQVVAVTETSSEEPKLHAAIFQFMGDDFSLFNGRNEPVAVPARTLAENGVSATLYPEMVMSMVMVGGIGIGRDYSFEMVGGENITLVAHDIRGIKIEEPPAQWKAPGIARYTAKVAGIRRILEKEKAAYNEFRHQGLKVRTLNSVYYFTPTDQDFGTRTISKEGGDSCQGRLIYVNVGQRMEFDNFDTGETASTSEVLEITPWSEDQETTE